MGAQKLLRGHDATACSHAGEIRPGSDPIHGSLDPPESKPHTASRSVQDSSASAVLTLTANRHTDRQTTLHV